ncbi:MAG: glycosyltransferase family 2 protein [Planctomycetes bacterium]|nr:glycosyltransferase family 2 protein [Planctomycetota bacterium]
MTVYYVLIVVVLIWQLLSLYLAKRHFFYVLKKYRSRPTTYHPRTALIAPCKGIDTAFERNVSALFELDYPDYEIVFVVESTSDPAYAVLSRLIEAQKNKNKSNSRLIVAGVTQHCSQKIHNLLAGWDVLDDEVEVLAFIDSDVCPKAHWLASLVAPLKRKSVGASTGYRLYVPIDFGLSSTVLSAVNALIASTLGPHRLNAAWGGSMAIRKDIAERIQLRQAWQFAGTDDYTLTAAVKKSGLRIYYVPACLVASYDQMSWPQLFSFATRQFIITRVCMKPLWRLALLNFLWFVAVFWSSLFFMFHLLATGSADLLLAAVLPAVIAVVSALKAAARQWLVMKILPEDRKRLVLPALIDIFCQPLLAVFTLVCLIASATTRKIVWRGVGYTLHSPTRAEIIHLSRGA